MLAFTWLAFQPGNKYKFQFFFLLDPVSSCSLNPVLLALVSHSQTPQILIHNHLFISDSYNFVYSYCNSCVSSCFQTWSLIEPDCGVSNSLVWLTEFFIIVFFLFLTFTVLPPLWPINTYPRGSHTKLFCSLNTASRFKESCTFTILNFPFPWNHFLLLCKVRRIHYCSQASLNDASCVKCSCAFHVSVRVPFLFYELCLYWLPIRSLLFN